MKWHHFLTSMRLFFHPHLDDITLLCPSWVLFYEDAKHHFLWVALDLFTIFLRTVISLSLSPVHRFLSVALEPYLTGDEYVDPPAGEGFYRQTC